MSQKQIHTCQSPIALMHLSLLDLVLDAFLLDPPLLCVSPPDRAFVFAFHTQIYTGSAGGMLLITLLSAQAACEATYFRGTNVG